MSLSLSGIIALLVTYKYVVLFPIVVVEGPIVTVLSGFLASLGTLDLFIAYGIIVLGNIVGDNIAYALGRWGGPPLLDRWGRYVGMTSARLKPYHRYFVDHPATAIIWGKLAFSLEIPFLVGAGLAQVPYWKFFIYSFLPTLPKSMLFLLIGYYFGHSYIKISTYMDYAALGMITFACALTAVFFFVKNLGRRHTGDVH